jgi:hypothetical protein
VLQRTPALFHAGCFGQARAGCAVEDRRRRRTTRPHRRAAIEDEFGSIKNEWALSPLHVRGLDRVLSYARLPIPVACALARERLADLAAQSFAGDVPLGGVALRPSLPFVSDSLVEVVELHDGSLRWCFGARWR